MAVNMLLCVYGNFIIPQRYILCLLTFMGVGMAYSMRSCLHIAITEMVQPIKPENPVDNSEACPGNHTIINDEGKYNWTEQQQGIVLAAFFPGYMMTQVPGGIVADKFGGKHVFSVGIAISGLLTLLTPMAIKYGDWWALAILRCLMGVGQGPLFPSITSLLARWTPPHERSRMTTLVSTGVQVGTITGNLVSSLLIAFSGGCNIVFYFWGLVCFTWYLFFFFLCYSEPSHHPFISEEEALMLEQQTSKQDTFEIPWKQILVYPPVWALVCAGVGHDWLFFLIIVELPKYMADVLKFNVRENGALNSIPYGALMITSVISGVLADSMINTNLMTVVNTRILFTAIGKIGPAIFVVLISYMGCDGFGVEVMFCLCMVTMGPVFAGMKVNTLDITQSFAGAVMGVVNGLGAVAFVPVPYLVAIVTSDYTLMGWRKVFWALFITSIVTTIPYTLWASAERAEWDKHSSET